MPIEVDLPDGSVAEFPDGTPNDVIKGALQKRFAQPSVAEDVAKAGASGTARGVADMVGLPGTIGDALRGGMQWGLGKGYELVTGEAPGADSFFGVNPELEAQMIGGGSNPLSGENLRGALSTATGGATDYQPKTTQGEYARTGGEFIGGAIGPGGAARKAAQVLIPAFASETAGQMTEGGALEPYARIAGALLGGGVSAIGAGRNIPKTPTAKEIFREGGNAYEAAKPVLKDVKVTNPTYQNIVGAMQREADDFGIVPEVHGPVEGFLGRHAKAAAPTPGVVGSRGAEPSLYDLELARRGLGHIGGSNVTNKSLGALSGKLTDTLDEAVETLPQGAFKVEDATEADKALETLATARETWKTGIKSQMVENAIEQARNAASGFENGLRVEFRKLLKDKAAKNFTETELNAIKTVARGTVSQNALRWLGGFGVPTDNGRNFLGSVVGAFSGNAIGGPVGAVALPALGTAAKVGAGSIAEKNAAIVDALVKSGRAGGDLYKKSVGAQTEARRQAIARALLQASIADRIGVSGQSSNTTPAYRP